MAQSLSDLPLKLATGFESPIVQCPKEVASIDLDHRTMMLRYLNMICEPQLPSPQ